MSNSLVDEWYVQGAILLVLGKAKDSGEGGLTEEQITERINELELQDQIKAMEIGYRLKKDSEKV